MATRPTKRARSLLVELALVDAQIKKLNAAKATLATALIDLMSTSDLKSFSVTVNGDAAVTGTKVAAETVRIDPNKLATALSAAEWTKITDRVLNTKKLEAEVAVGKIDPVLVAGCSEIVPSKPYIKLSGRYAQPDLDQWLEDQAASPRKVVRRSS